MTVNKMNKYCEYRIYNFTYNVNTKISLAQFNCSVKIEN